jgi:hypothetical protein
MGELMMGWGDNLAAKRRLCLGALPGVMMIALAGSLAAQASIDPPSSDCSAWYLNQAVVVGQYTFKAFKNPQTGAACLEVEEKGFQEKKVMGRMAERFIHKEGGQVVFRRTSESFGQFTLGQPAQPQNNIAQIENGTDITGHGRPNMIVTNWSGGAHCCFSHFIFELQPKLTLLAEIDDADGGDAHFATLDGDRQYYFVGKDWTFAYWDASFTESPAPAVVLRLVDDGRAGSYRLAMDKMERAAPSSREWDKAVYEAQAAFAERNSFGDGIGSVLWSNMLNLVYTNHSDLAWKLMDDAWPAQRPGKEKFISDFCSQLKTSPYWPDLGATLGTCGAADHLR